MTRYIASKHLLQVFIVLSMAFSSLVTVAQACPAGEVPFALHIHTDNWGFEMYWAITADGENCDSNPLFWGGNELGVGCSGEGVEGAEEGSYPSNAFIVVDSLCAVPGELLTLHHVDSYGDGGTFFEVYVDGALTNGWQGTGDGNVWTFDPFYASGPDYDSPCAAMEIQVDGPMVVVNTDSCGTAFQEPAPPNLGCQVYGGWCEVGVTQSAWLSFTATEGNCYISACTDTTNFDTQMALWKATDCGDFDTYTLIGANDDIPGGCGPGNGYASALWTGCLDSGETYLIQVDGWYSAAGQAGVTIVSVEEETSVTSSSGGLDCALGKEETPDGSILLSVAGSGSNYVTAWVGPNGYSGEGQEINGLEAGTYSCVILNSCGSSLVHTVTLIEPDPIALNLDVVGPDCPEQSNGEASLSVTGGAAPFEIQWFNDLGEFNTGEFVEGLTEGDYTVELEDDNGCEVSLPFEVVADDAAFTFSLGADTTICDDEQLILSAPVGLTYVWSNGSADQFIVISGTDLGPGTYPITVVASNAEGCSHADALFVTVFDCTTGVENLNPNVAIEVAPNPTREGQSWMVEARWLSDKTTTWHLRDGQGRMVRSGTHLAGAGQRLEVPSEGLAAGQYLLLFPEAGTKVRLIRR